MKLPLHHVIQPGLVHFMAYPAIAQGEGPVLEAFRATLSDSFFEGIEITLIKDPTVREQVKAMIQSASVVAKYCVHPQLLGKKLDLNSADEAARRRAIDEVKAGIEVAVGMDIFDVGFPSGWDVPKADRAAAMDRLEASLVELCQFGAQRGTKLVLEVFDRDMDKKCLIGPADVARAIAERVKRNCANFGLVVDLSHIPLLGESPAQALRPVATHLAHTHIGNAYFQDRANPLWGDNHPRFGYPGGVNDVPQIVEFLRELFAIGYLTLDGTRRGTVSFEIKTMPGEEPTVMLAAAKRKLVEAWALLDLDAPPIRK